MASIGVGNRVMSGEEFAQELQQDLASDLCAVTGVAKRSGADNDSEILFTQDLRGGSWTKIPVVMVESVEILGRASVRGEVCHHVRLHLRSPSGPEATVLSRLLCQHEAGAAFGGGETVLGTDGVVPLLKANDGVLPLSLVVNGNGGTLPLSLDNGFILLGWRVGN